jgi:hypothetical protein
MFPFLCAKTVFFRFLHWQMKWWITVPHSWFTDTQTSSPTSAIDTNKTRSHHASQMTGACIGRSRNNPDGANLGTADYMYHTISTVDSASVTCDHLDSILIDSNYVFGWFSEFADTFWPMLEAINLWSKLNTSFIKQIPCISMHLFVCFHFSHSLQDMHPFPP